MGHGEGYIVWLSNVAVLKTDCCSSAAESCPTLCDLIPGSPVLLPEFAGTHVHYVDDAI